MNPRSSWTTYTRCGGQVEGLYSGTWLPSLPFVWKTEASRLDSNLVSFKHRIPKDHVSSGLERLCLSTLTQTDPCVVIPRALLTDFGAESQRRGALWIMDDEGRNQKTFFRAGRGSSIKSLC